MCDVILCWCTDDQGEVDCPHREYCTCPLALKDRPCRDPKCCPMIAGELPFVVEK